MKLVLDIETIPCEEATRNLLSPIAPPGNLKEEEKIREWEESILPSLREQRHHATALDGTLGRIICIALMALSDESKPKETLAIYGNKEKELLVNGDVALTTKLQYD